MDLVEGRRHGLGFGRGALLEPHPGPFLSVKHQRADARREPRRGRHGIRQRNARLLRMPEHVVAHPAILKAPVAAGLVARGVDQPPGMVPDLVEVGRDPPELLHQPGNVPGPAPEEAAGRGQDLPDEGALQVGPGQKLPGSRQGDFSHLGAGRPFVVVGGIDHAGRQAASRYGGHEGHVLQQVPCRQR